MPLILRRCKELRLYAENPQTIDARYFISWLNENGLIRLRVPAPVACRLTEVDSKDFEVTTVREFLRASVHNDPWYDELPFPRLISINSD